MRNTKIHILVSLGNGFTRKHEWQAPSCHNRLTRNRSIRVRAFMTTPNLRQAFCTDARVENAPSLGHDSRSNLSPRFFHGLAGDSKRGWAGYWLVDINGFALIVVLQVGLACCTAIPSPLTAGPGLLHRFVNCNSKTTELVKRSAACRVAP